MPALPTINFTHSGVFCADLDRMVDFYCRTLGFIVATKVSPQRGIGCFS